MKNLFYSFLTFVLFVFVNISHVNAQQINSKIEEVYGSSLQQIMQNDSERIKLLTDLLENRIRIVQVASVGDDKYPKLSEVALLNKYNSGLKRDVVFDPNNFNPLKYNLNFFSLKTEAYRVDNTDYVIVINPQTISK